MDEIREYLNKICVCVHSHTHLFKCGGFSFTLQENEAKPRDDCYFMELYLQDYLCYSMKYAKHFVIKYVFLAKVKWDYTSLGLWFLTGLEQEISALRSPCWTIKIKNKNNQQDLLKKKRKTELAANETTIKSIF